MDYFETFAPVVRHDSLRAMLAIAAIQDLEIRQLDIKGTYLNGDLQEEIYMQQPEGFDDRSGRVCRLYRTLYGLKQSGHYTDLSNQDRNGIANSTNDLPSWDSRETK